MEQMEGIRDQQESLARLHFELTTKQDLTQPMSEDGKNLSFVPSFNTSVECLVLRHFDFLEI